MYIVYKHTNSLNNKVYIGITSQKPEQRWGINGANYKSSPHFYLAIQKYGWNNFEHEILFTNLSKEDACLKEQELIKFYNSMDKEFGYNQTSGGECCVMADESKLKLSQALIGNKNGAGHPCSDEKKQKISNAQKGKKLTEEHKDKLSKAASKRHIPCSETKKKLLSQNYPKKRKVYCEELDVVFESVQECSRQLDIPATNISKLCNGRGKTLKGYHLKYYNDTINA